MRASIRTTGKRTERERERERLKDAAVTTKTFHKIIGKNVETQEMHGNASNEVIVLKVCLCMEPMKETDRRTDGQTDKLAEVWNLRGNYKVRFPDKGWREYVMK